MDKRISQIGPTLILNVGDVFDEYPDPDLEKHILPVITGECDMVYTL